MPDVTGKIKRKFMAHYIDSALPSASKAEYSRLGKDLEEYTVEMNANVETKIIFWVRHRLPLTAISHRLPRIHITQKSETHCLYGCRPL